MRITRKNRPVTRDIIIITINRNMIKKEIEKILTYKYLTIEI
jgi:hypothetical protein